MLKIRGLFTRYIYNNQSTNFYVGLLKVAETNDKELVGKSLSVSSFEPFQLNVHYNLEIEKDIKSKYANSYKLMKLEEIIPVDKNGIIDYFTSGAFPGLGKASTTKIIEYFGENMLLSRLFSNPNLIKEQKLNLSEKLKNVIYDKLQNDKSKKEVIEYFEYHKMNLKITKKMTSKIFASFFEKYAKNPYLLWMEDNEITFAEADHMAIMLKLDKKIRELYTTLYLLNTKVWNSGSTWISLKIFYSELSINFFSFDMDKYENILKNLIDNKLAYAHKHFITSWKYYWFEKNIAKFFKEFLNIKTKTNDIYSEYYPEYLDDIQISAVKNSLKNKISIITGEPGTGKTEILKTILQELKLKYTNIIVMAPTGRAAYQIREKTGFYDASTIHSYLWSLKSEKQNKKTPDVIIIDEFSMVSTELFHELINMIDDKNALQKIILIGDYNQIPSIEPGNLLLDFIDSDLFSVTVLKNNYRQISGSKIIEDARAVIRHLEPKLNSSKSKLVETEDTKFYSVLKKYLDKFDFKNNMDDLIILSPFNVGELGTKEINLYVQSYLFKNENPLFTTKNGVFYKNDKVMHLINNNEKGIYNGEIGYIDSVHTFKDKIKKILIVYPEKRYIEYDLTEWNNQVSLSYAVSVHKFQGSESKNVIVVLFDNHSSLLESKLLYTAFTRARQNLIVIGKRTSLINSINKKNLEFYTRMKDFLEEIKN